MLAFGGGFAVPSLADAGVTLNISGTWDCCGAGGAAEQSFDITQSGSNYEFTYQDSVNADSTSDNVIVQTGSCGSSASGDIAAAAQLLCGMYEGLDLTSVYKSWPAPPPNFLSFGSDDRMKVINMLLDVLNEAAKASAPNAAAAIGGAAAKAIDSAGSNPSQTTQLEDADSSLAVDFPASSDSDASAEASSVALGHVSGDSGLDPQAVIQSLVSPSPSHADLLDFAQAITLATAPTYSPVRAEARLSLVAAVDVGESLLAHDLHHDSVAALLRSKLPPIATETAKTSKRQSSKRFIKASPDGGRILRIFEVWGLGHKVTLKLRVSARGANGRQYAVTRTIRVV